MRKKRFTHGTFLFSSTAEVNRRTIKNRLIFFVAEILAASYCLTHTSFLKKNQNQNFISSICRESKRHK